MKKRISKIAGFILLAIGLFTACEQPGPENGTGTGLATLTLSVGESSSRTVTYAPSGALYVLKGRLGGGDERTLGSWPSLTGTLSVTLETGSWSFLMEAYDGEGKVILEDSQDALIAGPGNLSFTLRALERGTGAVDVTVTWPVGSDVVSLRGTYGGEDISAALTIGDGSARYYDGAVPAGDEVLNIQLLNGSGAVMASVTELVRVRMNLTSARTVALTADDLNSPPEAPADVTASTTASADEDHAHVVITWSDRSDNETGFAVYRNGTYLSSVEAARTSYGDDTAARGTEYTYSVIAVNSFGTSLSGTAPALATPFLIRLDLQGGNLGGETSPAGREILPGAVCTLADPVRTGYNFAGWYTGANASGTAHASSFAVDGNLILYAYWGLVAEAGDDFATYGLGQTTLIGSVKHATGSVTYQWEAAADNPSPVTLSDSDAAMASFLVSLNMSEGDYRFSLTASDDYSSDTDQVTVTVKYLQKLLASDGSEGDMFGYSIAMDESGMTAIIGAQGDDENGSLSGSAYIYTFNNNTNLWSQSAKILPEGGEAYDQFGCSVALSYNGNMALIGVQGDMGMESASTGAVHVYVNGGSTWSRAAILVPSDCAGGDRFGASVSLGDGGATAIIGAPGKDGGKGAAYIYSLQGTWIEEAKLTSPGGGGFGTSVTVASSLPYVAVGAPFNDDVVNNGGTAFLYVHTGGAWNLVTELTPPDLAEKQLFGTSLSLSEMGTTLLVGSPGDYSNKGSAYIYSRAQTNSLWSQEAKLADTASSRDFGMSVSLGRGGTLALIGADMTSSSKGAAYVYAKEGEAWEQALRLAVSDGANSDYFGYCVCFNAYAQKALVAGPFDDDRGSDSGSVYAFGINF